jgi:hypothetical protein
MVSQLYTFPQHRNEGVTPWTYTDPASAADWTIPWWEHSVLAGDSFQYVRVRHQVYMNTDQVNREIRIFTFFNSFWTPVASGEYVIFTFSPTSGTLEVTRLGDYVADVTLSY